MIAPEWDKMMSLAKFDDETQDRGRIRPTINIISQCDDGVVRTKCDRVNQRPQGINAAMDITDCEMTGHQDSLLFVNSNIGLIGDLIGRLVPR